MFNFFKSNKSDADTATTEKLQLKINGMHCTSCSLNIDGELEDTTGVIDARTSYAHSRTAITYDPAQVTPATLKQVVTNLGYQVVEVE